MSDVDRGAFDELAAKIKRETDDGTEARLLATLDRIISDHGDGPVAGGRGGHHTCDTPTCAGDKEVITPDGYVCRDCADVLGVQYESDTNDLRADGGGKYHVVCPDCNFEGLTRHRHRAARAVDAHRYVKPAHEARFEEVAGR
jgi:DNA-directed RNA polymerase subunit RPC12/RpoP